jgi:Flp pilus assembly protein TadD
VAAIVVISAASTFALAGNTALSQSGSARRDGDWNRAVAEARRAASWMPWSPAPWEALGRAQLGAGRIPEARASFRKAISIDSGDWELWYHLARASSGKSRQHALREAARLFPRARFVRAAARGGR